MLRTSEIIFSEEHIDPKRDPGFVIYKLGYIGPVINGARTAHMLWGNGGGGPGGTAEPLPIITQTGHGFIQGNAIRHNGTSYVKAQADNDTNAQVCGIISEVLSADTFRYISGGLLPGPWTAGAEYFLSPITPGLVTTIEDPEIWQVGQVRISLGFGTTQGLKVEIDVGDLIGEFELPTARLVGYWDRDAEFCASPGVAEVFDLDRWAVFNYTITEAITEADGGILQGASIKINGTPIQGMANINIGAIAKTIATGANQVNEGDRVTIETGANFSGDPSTIKIKLKILRE